MLATFKFTGAPLHIFGMELSEHQFATGGRRLLFPGFLQAEVLAWALLAAFLLCASAFALKSLHEVAQGRLNLPKTLHMVLAAGLFFVTPALQNLDVAFQGLNTWHSVQYLAVVIFINRCRQAQGPDRLARRGALRHPRRAPLRRRPGPDRRLRGGVPGAARDRAAARACGPATHCSSTTSPFTSRCCPPLLIHYYFDHFLFLRIDGVINPRGESTAQVARPGPAAAPTAGARRR